MNTRLPILTVAAVAAAGSAGLLLRLVQLNTSIVVLVLMVIWVLSPYLALAGVAWKRLGAMSRTAFESVIVIISVGSLALYVGDALRAHRERPVAIFVIVPPVAWAAVVIAVALAILRRMGRRKLNS